MGFDATRERLPEFLSGMISFLPVDTRVTWFYSDSTADTDIPNEVGVAAQAVTDPDTGEVISDAVVRDATASDFRFTDLDDELINHAWAVTLPLELGRHAFELSGGYNHARKARTAPVVVPNSRTSRWTRRPVARRTQATTVSLWTSRPT